MNDNPGFSVWIVPRIVAGVFAIPPTAFSLLVLSNQLRTGFDWLGAAFGLGVGTMAFLGWWFALHGQHEASRINLLCSLLGGLLIGGISFALGFFGPIIFMPQSNQGPLLGIFITGPIGFVIGVVVGAIVGHIRRARLPDDVAGRDPAGREGYASAPRNG